MQPIKSVNPRYNATDGLDISSLFNSGTQAVSQAVSLSNYVNMAKQFVDPYVNDIKHEINIIKNQYIPNTLNKFKTDISNELTNKIMPNIRQQGIQFVSDATDTVKPKVDVMITEAKDTAKKGIIFVSIFAGAMLLTNILILIAILRSNRKKRK
jgi:hypothetical protein